MYFLKRSILTTLWVCVLFLGCIQTSVNAVTNEEAKLVKNVVLMIPDGFSSAYATNYRIFKDGDFALDSMLVGMVSTYSASSWVTDSAAAATALATGIKTKNGMIGIDSNGKRHVTILEAAKEAGKSTGLIATKAITDATPAAFGAHVESRKQEAEIAEQLIHKVDVLLGGGKQHFLPVTSHGNQYKRNLIEEARSNGYQFYETGEELLRIKGNEKKVLGLFADNMLAAEIDRDQTNEPSLAEMTGVAISLLERNKSGFFLMVEGSKIDRAGHAHDAGWAMNDIAAFEQAVITAKEFAEKNEETLVVVVGDHDTGGLSVGGYNEYVAMPEVLREVKATAGFMSDQINANRTNIKQVIKEYTNIDISKEEIEQIKQASKRKMPASINKIINERAYIDWITTEHTGVDVPIYAVGPNAHLFQGHIDNTEVPKKLARAMGLKFEGNK